MSLYVSGDRDKVGKLKKLAEKMGLEPLYSDEKVSASDLTSAMKTTPYLEKKIAASVSMMERKYAELGRPVSPWDIMDNINSGGAADKMSHYLRMAHLKGMVYREVGRKNGRKVYLYRPVQKAAQ